MPGLSDPNDTSFTEGHQAGAWRWNADAGRWEPTDPLLAAGFGLPRALGLEATPINTGAPGSYLSAGNSEADRARLGGYLSQLQGQAATGGGAWEHVLAQNTDATKAGAMALGQSQEGVDPMTAGRNIGNAASGAEQRAVGQGNLLRAQTQQQATGQLSDILAGQQGLDAQQAAGQAGAAQGLNQMNHGLQSQAVKNQKDLVSGFGQAAIGGATGMSEGGEVPGKPKVFGDSSVNDTVKAKLTPLEIVLPLSVTMAPDAPDRAAAFVAAVKARGPTGTTHFDGGGQVPNFTDIQGEDAQGRSSTHEWLSSGGREVLSSRNLPVPEKTYAPGKVPPLVANGGLLDTHNYNQTRNAALENQDALGAAAAGYGPSVAPQAMQNATDATLASALRADANSRGGANPNLVSAGAEQQQEAAGNAAGMAAGEQQRAGGNFAEAVNRQRSQDLGMARQQQQAAWRNTMMNAGIGLEQQQQLTQLLGAGGQGFMAASSLFPSNDGPQHSYATSTHEGGLDSSSDHGGSSMGYGDAESSHYAEGGVVAHLARHGTRQAPRRPSGKGASPSPEAASPRPTGLEYRELREHPEASGGASVDERDRIGGMLKKIERARIQQYDAENPDLKDLEPAYAEGGEVNFAGTPTGVPQPGPFAAPQANSGSLIDFLSRLQRPGGGPFAEDARVRPPPTPEELVLQSRNGVTPPAAPRLPTDVATRERPFIAKPPQTQTSPTQTAPQVKAPSRPGVPVVDPLADQKRALGMEADAKTQQADATAQALGTLQQGLETNAIAQNEAHARASEQAEQQLGVIQQAREDLKSIDTTVDPDRLMARRGWAGKISAIVGLVLGAIGNDNGINRAAQLLNQQIDRDLDAQKSEHELALRKGQSAVDSAQTVYSLSRQMTQDDIAANHAARGTMLDLAKNQIDIAATKAGAPLAKSNLAMLSAQLDAEKKKSDEALKQRSFDNHIKQQNADSDRIRALKEGNAPGVAAQTALLATVQTEEATIKQQGEKLKALIKKYGTAELTGPAEAEMRQAVDNMAVAAAKLKDPNSAARPSEVEVESRNIFKPGFFKQASTALSQVDSYLANSEQRRRNAFDARGVAVPGVTTADPAKAAGQDDAGARAWLADPKNASSPLRAKVQAKLEGR